VEKNIPPEIKIIANTAKTLVGIYSGVSEFINVATTIARFLEIIPGTQDTARAYMEHQFNFLNAHLDAVAADIEWTITNAIRSQNLAKWDGAINAATDDNNRGIRIAYRDSENLDTFTVLDEYTNAEPCRSGGNFQRYDKESVTDGEWKEIIDDRKMHDPDRAAFCVPPDHIYDWRKGIPDLMQLIPSRLMVMIAVDPDFKHNTLIHDELKKFRDALRSHYDMMLKGVRCNYHGDPNSLVADLELLDHGYRLACADIYSGLSVVKTYPNYLVPPVANRFDYYSFVDTTLTEMRRELLLKLPLFEMQSMIDMLTLYLNPGLRDLTAGTQQIALLAAPNLCLEGGNAIIAGPPVWLWPCNGSDTQRWVYDRQHGTIRNPVYNLYLDVQRAGLAPGTPVWLWDYTGTEAQQWTYNPETGVLQNALGNVLDVQGGVLQLGTPVWTWTRNGDLAQLWY